MTKALSVQSIVRAALAALFAVLLIAPVAASADKLDVEIVPFFWAPHVEGTLDRGPLTIPLSVGPDTILKGAKSAALGYVEARGHHFEASAQLIYYDSHDPHFAPLMSADVTSRVFSFEGLAGPRFAIGHGSVTALAGARYHDVHGTLALGPFRSALGRTWTEGLVGARLELPVVPRVNAQLRGVIAVAGPRGEVNHDVNLTASYRLSHLVSLVGGYRWSREALDSNGGGAPGFRLRSHGPLVGIAFRPF